MRLIYEATGALTIVWLVLLFVQGVLPGLTVYLTKLVLDGAEAALNGGMSWENMSQLLVPAGAMGAALLTAQIVSAVQKYVQTAQAEKLQDHVQNVVQAKAIELEFAFFDASDSYDKLERASGEAGSRTNALLGSAGGLLQSAVGIIGIGAVLVPYGLWLPLALIAAAAPALAVVVRHNRRYHSWWEDSTPDRRMANYFNILLTNNVTAAEMRLLSLGEFFRESYATLRARLRGERLDLLKKQGIGNVLAGLTGLAVTGFAMAWIIVRALRGAASLGDLGLFYRAFNEGQNLMRTTLSHFGQLLTSMLFIQHLFEFMELEPTVTSPTESQPVPEDLEDGIRFHDVTFAYRGTDRPAIRDFNLHVPAGKVTAIVGPNGAGKSTLTKLISRLYDPDEGRVTFDGVDIRSFDLEDLWGFVTLMLQTPITYHATAAENIAMGSLGREVTEERLVEAAKGALIHKKLSGLPQGYDTQLGRYFGSGIELSGGEWQRVMLARAFYRQSPIVMLDEPTSAMDSWTENQWLQRFGQLVQGRTTVIITHRFTTAMCADVIHVMVNGRIIESGNHQELLALGGHYADSWNAQVEQGWRPVSELEPEVPG